MDTWLAISANVYGIRIVSHAAQSLFERFCPNTQQLLQATGKLSWMRMPKPSGNFLGIDRISYDRRRSADQERSDKSLFSERITLHREESAQLWHMTVPGEEMEHLAFTVRKNRQRKRLEHWLATELQTYELRDRDLFNQNDDRRKQIQELQLCLPGEDESVDLTRSQAAIQEDMLEMTVRHQETEVVRRDLKQKIDLSKETILAERGEQNFRWDEAMRGIEDCLQANDLLHESTDEYREARNRLPAALQNFNAYGERVLQKYRHRKFLDQRLKQQPPEEPKDNEVPTNLQQLIPQYNEAVHERNRARDEFENRKTAYEYRWRKYNELIAQGFQVPTREEFDRQWVIEVARLTADFIAAEKALIPLRRMFKRHVPGSVIATESIPYIRSEEHLGGASEYLINETHRKDDVLDWRRHVPEDSEQLAPLSTLPTPPSSQYSGPTIPFGHAESMLQTGVYVKSRAREYSNQLKATDNAFIAFDVRVPEDAPYTERKRTSEDGSAESAAKRLRTSPSK